MDNFLKPILALYNINYSNCNIEIFGEGLINNTWKILYEGNEYILQCINQKIFKNPNDIAFNISLLGDFLNIHHPDYLFTSPLLSVNEKQIEYDEPYGYFRLFSFIKNSHAVNVVANAEQAFEAAKQFGKFTKLLSRLNASQLKITLPDFHNLSLRYQQFENAIVDGNAERITVSKDSIQFLQQRKSIINKFDQIKMNSNFKIRVMHHDTKISNVLFDKNDKGLCVIDLDTVMPGYFISDVGDMMRTYLSPVSEEEKDFDRISIREDYFAAVVKGYLSEMKDELSEDEKNSFLFAGTYMIYMQAIRFLTDYLNNDIYYGAKYEDQNLVRANNQICLLQRLIDKEHLLNNILRKIV